MLFVLRGGEPESGAGQWLAGLGKVSTSRKLCQRLVKGSGGAQFIKGSVAPPCVEVSRLCGIHDPAAASHRQRGGHSQELLGVQAAGVATGFSSASVFSLERAAPREASGRP